MTLDYFPYKRRIAKNRERYINAYSLGLDTVSDWMTLAFMGDKQTPSRQALIDKCIEYSGIPYFDVTDNASDALSTCIQLYTKPGDQIITTAWGFIATMQSINWMGRRIVFCDNGRDGLMSIDTLEKAIEQFPYAKAVIPVNMLGKVTDVKSLLPVIPDDMYIIEDSANAFYMNDGGIKPGEYSDATVYSFDLAKNPASTGTGGAVGLNNRRHLLRFQEMTKQGFTKFGSLSTPATKSTMDDTSARIIVEDMSIMEENNVREIRRQNHKFFLENIQNEFLTGENYMPTGIGMYCSKYSGIEAISIFKKLDMHFLRYPCYAKIPAFINTTDRVKTLNISRRMGEELILIPCHEYLTEDEKNKIVEIANGL
jgi:dTDP-4-amino-4,6-dideoxygalactose transaminase